MAIETTLFQNESTVPGQRHEQTLQKMSVS